MEIMQILFKQIFLMFIYMMIGFTLYKKKMITKQGSKELATLLLYVILPMAIIKPFMIEFDYDKLVGLGKSFVIAVVALALSMLVAKLILGKNIRWKTSVQRFQCRFYRNSADTDGTWRRSRFLYRDLCCVIDCITVDVWCYDHHRR